MNIETECEGPGATHHFACKCREEMFEKMRVENEELKSIMVSNGALLYMHKEKLAVATDALQEIISEWDLSAAETIARSALYRIETIGGGDEHKS